MWRASAPDHVEAFAPIRSRKMTGGRSRTFFVTTKTSGGQSHLADRTDGQSDDRGVSIVYARNRGLLIHDFVVMPNHVHILMTIPGDLSIEKAMQLIKGRFSFRAGRELGFKGEVWQRGFSDVRITSDESFLRHCAYIEQNPMKTGLAERCGRIPLMALRTKKQTSEEMLSGD